MKRVPVLAVIVLAASSGVASAGTYLGLGIGTGPAFDSDKVELESRGRSGRAILGSRWSKLSVEGSLGKYTLMNEADGYQASAAGKLNFPLGSGFEVFGKLGVQHTWLRTGDAMYDASGNGYLVGGGFEYRLNLGIGATSIWVDYQYSHADLESERKNYDLGARMWTLGLSVGI